ncbi:MAG: hypothetical protein WC875_03120 [Candidatus Absconditabacterales bacterium]|jgi:hypothetical protein
MKIKINKAQAAMLFEAILKQPVNKKEIGEAEHDETPSGLWILATDSRKCSYGISKLLTSNTILWKRQFGWEISAKMADIAEVQYFYAKLFELYPEYQQHLLK